MSDRHPISRRTVCSALCSVGCVASVSTGLTSATETQPPTEAPSQPRPTQYVAVVDRIVDGEHVVLLLERDGDLVDQLVVDVGEFDDISERDLLVVVVRDGELLATRHIDDRPDAGPTSHAHSSDRSG